MTDPWLIQNTRKSNDPKDAASTNNSDAISFDEQPRRIDEQSTSETCLQFEDNFAPSPLAASAEVGERPSQSNNKLQPLPDSESYLQGLERKLQRLKKGANLVEALAEKRQDCLRTLLQDNDVESVVNNNAILELDTPISNGDSAVQEIYRHLQPVQPVTLGETVYIVRHDHLEQQRQEVEEEEEKSETDEVIKATVPEKNFN